MLINPIMLHGNWDVGFALDCHTVSSVLIGEDQFGHKSFHTIRTDLGELLYQFKYHDKYENLQAIVDAAKPFLDGWTSIKTVNVVLSAPFSNTDRQYQPAGEIAHGIAKYLNVPFVNGILKKTTSIQSKGMNSYEKEKIRGTIILTRKSVNNHNLLLVDDLYQTGATLNECVNALRTDENINKIFVLTITKTGR